MANIRKRYNAQEKAKIVLDILRGEMTQGQLITKYGINSGQLYKWKKQAVGSIVSGFSEKQVKQSLDREGLIEQLYQQIGQLKVELDWLKMKFLEASFEVSGATY